MGFSLLDCQYRMSADDSVSPPWGEGHSFLKLVVLSMARLSPKRRAAPTMCNSGPATTPWRGEGERTQV